MKLTIAGERIAGSEEVRGSIPLYQDKHGKPWASNSVSFVLRNPMYKGYMVYDISETDKVLSHSSLVANA
ncbi:recombinase family protein [Paenibacillus sp. N3.4]|uniref:recombinase family protein n=1 Tax=Paenibacillus sp. N3.4 TaxID=2603222 RepID=UPI00164FD4D4|nr:recombinase family protein [Paenibacillus sp. N3.4]